MIRYNRVQREMGARQRTQRNSGETIPPDVLDASGRCDGEVKAVYAAMRSNDDDALTKSLDTLEATLTDVEKYLGL